MKAYSSTVRILATLLLVAATSCLGGEDSRIEQKGNEKGLVSFYVSLGRPATIRQVQILVFSYPDGRFHSEAAGNLSPAGNADFSATLPVGRFSLLVGVDANESIRLAYPEGLTPGVTLTTVVSRVRTTIPASGGTPHLAILENRMVTNNDDIMIDLSPWADN